MLIAALLLQASTFSGTVPQETAGYELPSLFYLTCVRQLPLRGDVEYVMQLPSYKMTPASAGEVSNVLLRRDVTQAWSVEGKHGGQAILWLAPASRTCGLDIKTAERKQVETTFTEFLEFYYTGPGYELAEQPAQTIVERDGTRSVLRRWIVQVAGHRIALQGSFADAPIDGFQHKMTLTLID